MFFYITALWAAYKLLITFLGLTHKFSASTRGMISSASANLLMLYCSSPGCVSAQADTYLATGQLYLRGSALQPSCDCLCKVQQNLILKIFVSRQINIPYL